jgi:hypothetical protein
MTGANQRNAARPARTGKTIALSGLLALQVAAAAFFVIDVAADLLGLEDATGGLAHNLLEFVAVAVLIVLSASSSPRRKSAESATASHAWKRSFASQPALSQNCWASISTPGL